VSRYKVIVPCKEYILQRKETEDLLNKCAFKTVDNYRYIICQMVQGD